MSEHADQHIYQTKPRMTATELTHGHTPGDAPILYYCGHTHIEPSCRLAQRRCLGMCAECCEKKYAVRLLRWLDRISERGRR